MARLLEGKTALITGGNAGIGKAIALEFARQGADLALFGTNIEKGEAAVEEVLQIAGQTKVQFYQVDVSKTEPVEKAIKEVLELFGSIDILVNNSGITKDQLLMRMSEEEWDRVLDVNLKSCYNTCHALMRPMIKARRGKIINVGSIVGIVGSAGQCNYAASKAGMIGFTKALAKELGPRGILVNCIAPGYTETSMTQDLSESYKERIVQQIPLGRVGVPEDIASVALFLASSLSDYMTGQVLVVDGGMVM